MAVGDLVLPVEVVPDVHDSVHPGDVEDTGPRGAPAPAGEVTAVVLGGHDGGLEVLHPDPGRPVSYGHEELVVCRVPLDTVDGSVVLSRSGVVDGDSVVALLVPQVDGKNDSLLGSHQVLCRSSLLVVLHGASSESHSSTLAVSSQIEDVSGLSEPSRVPPHHLPVRGNGRALVSGLGGDPEDVVHRVVVGLFNNGGFVGHALFFGGIRLPQIVKADETVVTSTDESVCALGVEPQAAKGGGGKELNVGGVGVHDVPDVTAHGHLGVIHESLVLEVQNRVSNGNLSIRSGAFGMPVDASSGPFDIVRVPENCEALSTWGLRTVVGLNSVKVLLVYVDCVVLLHAPSNHWAKKLHGSLILLILLRLLPVPLHVTHLGRVNILRPASLHVAHGSALGYEALGVALRFRHVGGGVEL
mmetsp:Transcript_85/g.122  ORF Transcript_85/g.122 Transcript_85/m.122 type:complete len:414 (-) Transcript_85:173-1414(-)